MMPAHLVDIRVAARKSNPILKRVLGLVELSLKKRFGQSPSPDYHLNLPAALRAVYAEAIDMDPGKQVPWELTVITDGQGDKRALKESLNRLTSCENAVSTLVFIGIRGAANGVWAFRQFGDKIKQGRLHIVIVRDQSDLVSKDIMDLLRQPRQN